MEYADRMTSLEESVFSELARRRQELAAAGMPMFDFSIGTPDLSPEPHIIEAIQKGVSDPRNYRYAVSDIPDLTESVIEWYQNRYHVSLEANEVQSLMGSQEGLSHLALTIVNPGETVLTPDPGYPIFSIGPALASARVVSIPLHKENNYLMDLDSIPEDIARSARMMIVSYPNNPTAATAPPEFYEHLIWFAKKYNIVVLHDNAYSELMLDGKPGDSFLCFKGAKEVGVEFNSLSKSYNIPGCRLAFAVGNSDIIRGLRTLKSHLDYGIFLPFQFAAIAALRGPQSCVDRVRDTYRHRRNLICTAFSESGWNIPPSPSTMFLWAPIPERFASSRDFALSLMETTGIVTVPGTSFGHHGEGFVRLAMVQPEDKILQAAAALRKMK